MSRILNGQHDPVDGELKGEPNGDRRWRGWSIFVIALFFGLLLWGRLRLRDDVTKVVVAEPETAHEVEVMKRSERVAE